LPFTRGWAQKAFRRDWRAVSTVIAMGFSSFFTPVLPSLLPHAAISAQRAKASTGLNE